MKGMLNVWMFVNSVESFTTQGILNILIVPMNVMRHMVGIKPRKTIDTTQNTIKMVILSLLSSVALIISIVYSKHMFH